MSDVQPPQRHYDRSSFVGLVPPDPDQTATYEGVLVGSALILWFGPTVLRLAGMGGWYGKRFLGGGRAVNLLGPLDEGRTGFPMQARIGPSNLDGQPTLVLSYGADSPFPWPRVRDELRVLEHGWLLGMTTVDLPLLRGFTTPFLLRELPDAGT